MNYLPFYLEQSTPPLTITDEPILISFRNAVPEITDTSYLTHAIYYYPAKFIPQVVRYCIKEYTLENQSIIDCFAGSGTVGLEAILMKRNAILADINLLLNHIIPIKIYQGSEPFKLSILETMLSEIFDSKTNYIPQWNNINYWYPAEMLNELSRYWGKLKTFEKNVYSLIIEASLLKVSKLFSYAEHKTPKLFKSKSKIQYINDLLKTDWKKQLKTFCNELCYANFEKVKQFKIKTKNQQNSVLYYGGVDATNFNYRKDLAIDCLITSPPYLQAQEYIRTAKLDLYWLGYSEQEIKDITKLEIPYRKAVQIIETPTLNSVISKLENTTLLPILHSYFCHTLNALENAMKRLKKNGKACIFVGNPKLDGVEIETWRILKEYFVERGYTFDKVYEDKIQNRQLFGKRKNKNPDGMKSEFLLVLSN